MKFIIIPIFILTFNLSSGETPPNIIIVMTDDQGYGDFGVTGNKIIETPSINSFASESVSFDRFYVSPVCAPTRASLLTGRYYLRTGVTGVTRGAETMKTEEVTIAEILRANGYTTGCFGKWHNGANYPVDPIGQGFDEFWGFTGGIIRNYFDTRLKHKCEVVDTEGYIIDLLTDKAIEFIENQKNRPFFCYIPYNVPHTPIQVPDELFKKYVEKNVDDYTAGIYAMCESADQNFKKLLNKLAELNLETKTIVIFLTDNGPNGNRFNCGMKGKKATVDEGGVRVPLWIRWKGHLKPRVVIQPADHIDILPTLLDLCNIPIPDSLSIDGKTLKPLIFGESVEWEERHLYSFYSGKGSIRNNRYRLTVGKTNKISLYDMIADPSQLRNIAHNFPEKTEEMQSSYQAWLNDVYHEDSDIPVEFGYSQQPVVELPVASGELSGGLKFKNSSGYAYDWGVNWKTTSDIFSWNVKVVTDGFYEIFLQYLVPLGCEGAKIEIKIGDKSLINETKEPFIPEAYPNRDQVDRGRPPEMKWKNFSWGKLFLEEGNYKVSVRAKYIPGPQVGELFGIQIKKTDKQL